VIRDGRLAVSQGCNGCSSTACDCRSSDFSNESSESAGRSRRSHAPFRKVVGSWLSDVAGYGCLDRLISRAKSVNYSQRSIA
jgi:hypothetical protein